MVDWVGSNGLKNLSTQTRLNLRLKIKLQPNPATHNNQPEVLGWVGSGWFCQVGGLDAFP